MLVIVGGYFAGALATNKAALKAHYAEVAEKSPLPVLLYNCELYAILFIAREQALIVAQTLAPAGELIWTLILSRKWPGSVRMFLYSSAGSHSLIVRSLEHEASRVAPRGPPKSTSSTGRVCPLMVRSSSPVSQSQILMAQSSEADAIHEKTGWKATLVMASRCD